MEESLFADFRSSSLDVDFDRAAALRRGRVMGRRRSVEATVPFSGGGGGFGRSVAVSNGNLAVAVVSEAIRIYILHGRTQTDM
jgi:hypothetical protein